MGLALATARADELACPVGVRALTGLASDTQYS